MKIACQYKISGRKIIEHSTNFELFKICLNFILFQRIYKLY